MSKLSASQVRAARRERRDKKKKILKNIFIMILFIKK